jgi:hypothetical protein
VLIFFTFSTTQEYYSMPCYPALALLLGSAMAMQNDWIRRGTRVLSVIAACIGLVTLTLFFLTRNPPHRETFRRPLATIPELIRSPWGTCRISPWHPLPIFGRLCWWLQLPSAWVRWQPGNGPAMPAFLAAALMMILFFHAARLAMAVFDPYLSSRPLAEAILKSPEGTLIVDHHYYTFSSDLFLYQPHRAAAQRPLQ